MRIRLAATIILDGTVAATSGQGPAVVITIGPNLQILKMPMLRLMLMLMLRLMPMPMSMSMSMSMSMPMPMPMPMLN